MESFTKKLDSLQKDVDSIGELQLIGFLFVIILALIFIAKSTVFNAIFNKRENVELSYQQTMMYALLLIVAIILYIRL